MMKPYILAAANRRERAFEFFSSGKKSFDLQRCAFPLRDLSIAQNGIVNVAYEQFAAPALDSLRRQKSGQLAIIELPRRREEWLR
jgi:hypothetical protein